MEMHHSAKTNKHLNNCMKISSKWISKIRISAIKIWILFWSRINITHKSILERILGECDILHSFKTINHKLWKIIWWKISNMIIKLCNLLAWRINQPSTTHKLQDWTNLLRLNKLLFRSILTVITIIRPQQWPSMEMKSTTANSAIHTETYPVRRKL